MRRPVDERLGSERIVRPAGPIDPDVGVLHLERAGEANDSRFSPLATYVNFAMHPDVVGRTRPVDMSLFENVAEVFFA